jgi:hypothetical protein
MELIQILPPDIVNLVPEIVNSVTVLVLIVVNIHVILEDTSMIDNVTLHVQPVLGPI